MDREDVLGLLRSVHDPELGVNVVDLGLIYELEVHDGRVELQMTLTAPGCPLGDTIDTEVRSTLQMLPGLRQLDFRIVFEPPWTPERMTPAGMAQLGWR